MARQPDRSAQRIASPARFEKLLSEPSVHALMTLLNGHSAQTRIVGGAVRNTLLDLSVSDIDLATTLRPDETMARARAAGHKVVPTGIVHGTVTVIVDATPFEVTTLRRDVETDGRHAIVTFAGSFEEDALRRDFTINQLSLSADGEVHDYADGLADLALRRVRFIGEPERRISEDYLRIMRFFRFHAQYAAGELDAAGLAACEALRSGMSRLSAERVRDELFKLLGARGAARTVPDFAARGIWREAAGELAPHVLAFQTALSIFPACDALTRLVALAVRGTAHAAELAARLKLSNADSKRLTGAASVMAAWGPSGVVTERDCQLAALHFGAAAVQDALAAMADVLGTDRALSLAKLPAPKSPFGGAAVLKLGVAPGPAVGAVIEQAITLWADLGFPDDAQAQDACLTDAAARIGRFTSG